MSPSQSLQKFMRKMLSACKSVFIKKFGTTQQQIILFIIVGAINTLFSYCCFAVLIYLGLHYALAAWIATCLGILFNFNTTGRVVFNNSRKILIIKFLLVYMLLYLLNVGMLRGLQVFSHNYYLTGFLVIFPLAAMSFILNKYFVFRARYEKN